MLTTSTNLSGVSLCLEGYISNSPEIHPIASHTTHTEMVTRHESNVRYTGEFLAKGYPISNI